jgi:hypothetical protein
MRRLRRAHQRHAIQQAKRHKKFKQKALAAGAAAAITLGAGVSLSITLAHTPDPHELPVSQDADGDLLTDAEETAIDSDVLNPDQNTNAIPDGVELARRCEVVFKQLPDYPPSNPDEISKIFPNPPFQESCDICGELVPNAPAWVINGRLDLIVEFPVLALHYMEHGSFTYAGDKHNGRVDVPALVQALELPLPYDPKAHQLPVEEDTDGDLLADNEEKALAYLPFEPDQNKNGTSDGIELAKLCAADINDLPLENEADPNEIFKGFAYALGIEICDICGEVVNMGGAWVTNPRLNLTVYFPILAIHYMEHGSFSYAGDVHNGRIDVPALLQALELRLPYEPNDHQLPVAKDADVDLLANKEEFAIGYQPFDDDQNENEIPDGVELAKRCAADVNDLPQWYGQGDPPEETYKIEHALDGLEQCDICGQWIHMGGWEIINPKLGVHYPEPNSPLDRMFLPDLALHYMNHGSFDCYGGIHRGRVNIALLLHVLEFRFPEYWNSHLLPLDYVLEPVGQLASDANDLDGDLLADSEELKAGYNLYNPDQDRDLTSDGIELVKQCCGVIDALPVYDPYGGEPPPKQTYKVEHEARGEETCHICAAAINMGFVEIINPQLELRIEVPFISLHYMEHTSFSYAGSINIGRVDVPLLVKILEMPRHCGDLGTIYLPGDLNEDCSENLKDIADVANRWLECTDPERDECEGL